MQRFVGLGCLSFLTSFCPISGRSHTGIGGFSPGGPDTKYVGCGSEVIIKNHPRDPPAYRTPINMQPVGTMGSLRGQCPRWSTPGQLGPCLGSCSVTPPSLVRNLGPIVAGMLRLAAFVGHQKRVHSSPRSACGSVLTQKSTPLEFLTTQFWPPPVLPRPQQLLP